VAAIDLTGVIAEQAPVVFPPEPITLRRCALRRSQAERSHLAPHAAGSIDASRRCLSQCLHVVVVEATPTLPRHDDLSHLPGVDRKDGLGRVLQRRRRRRREPLHDARRKSPMGIARIRRRQERRQRAARGPLHRRRHAWPQGPSRRASRQAGGRRRGHAPVPRGARQR
jgi:hypothetical protein